MPSMVPIKQIKAVRESSVGYDFSVIAYTNQTCNSFINLLTQLKLMIKICGLVNVTNILIALVYKLYDIYLKNDESSPAEAAHSNQNCTFNWMLRTGSG